MSARLDLGQRPDGAAFLIDAGDLDYHAHIMGPTGYGKTYLMKRMFQELAVKSDSALFFIDPDGDAD
jgi:type IV secretory pathway VirB4 component